MLQDFLVKNKIFNFKFILSVDINSPSAKQIAKKLSDSLLIKNFEFTGSLSLEKAAFYYSKSDIFFTNAS